LPGRISDRTPENGGDKMEKLKPGDRVWVKTPRLVAERKIGTIIATKKTRSGLRYLIEWDIDLEETPNHHPGYLDTEIAGINGPSDSRKKDS